MLNEITVMSIMRQRNVSWNLKIFSNEEISALTLYEKKGKPYLKCIIREKEILAKPEEIVRQLFLVKLIKEYGYLREQIKLEKSVQFGATVHEKSADIVIYDKDNQTPYIIVELKKPNRKDGIDQLKGYCNAEGAPIGVWTNGGDIVVLHRDEPNIYSNLPDIPHANQTLSDVLNNPWTLDDLKKFNRLDTTQATLKSVILDMEDLVLANAGVNGFEEVFKLIFAKLYDEWKSANSSKLRYLQFRNTGTSKEVFDRVTKLFEEAQDHWVGVFREGETFDLSLDHLKTCVSFLENIKLFNSNLQVIDEAFEYLTVKDAKGEKGQYFTPRHVIDMAVKMLDPNDDEYIIDTAAGSCGFTVHTIFHVWGNLFEAKGPNDWQKNYASKYVYAIDFDPRSIKIAKALNLIAGDGKTNVFRANTLDPRNWSEDVKLGLKSRLLKTGNRADDRSNLVLE
ncbi:Restriction enzyme BgcI subunit alpha [Sporomusa ovata DSM 2662]|uniref:Type I restriction-modification enzyme M subunit n=2 Tax=Sporomusa ovata TaxID=2378 RepID=A0A0U1KRD7_9FIRM|nr:type I restriction enzyme HsdR N-terminal domain-containing protein [Sporomusa ovata]EQB27620.1 type I restriction-modification system methyltransferase subunit [Sporomusa ovata DSM 2662]CQR69972.1 Type I restriction-modification enzyme M subunit [Sporomusa ovata]